MPPALNLQAGGILLRLGFIPEKGFASSIMHNTAVFFRNTFHEGECIHMRKMKLVQVVLMGVVLLGLLAAQVLPASALEITFTTEGAPLVVYITGSSPANGATGVSPYTSITLDFNALLTDGQKSGVRLFRASDNIEISVSRFNRQMGPGLTPNTTLESNTEYYVAYPIMTLSVYNQAGGTGGAYLGSATLDPTESHNAPYWNAGRNQFEIHFTTAGGLTVNSTDIGGATGTAAGGQTGVSINAVIKVKTSNALNGATVNSTNVVLHEGSGAGTVVSAAAELDSSDSTNKTILVTPSAALKYSTTYTLVLSSVADTLGQVLP